MHTVAETIGFFSVFLLACTGFFLIGFFTIRNPERTARFFRGFGSQMYGKKAADRVYTARNQLWAAWPFVIVTPLGGALSIHQIAHAIVTGSGG